MNTLHRQNNIKKYSFSSLIENLDATVSILSNQMTVCFVNPNIEHLFCRQYRITNEESSSLTTADSVKSHVLGLQDLADFVIKAKYSFDNLTENDLNPSAGNE